MKPRTFPNNFIFKLNYTYMVPAGFLGNSLQLLGIVGEWWVKRRQEKRLVGFRMGAGIL